MPSSPATSSIHFLAPGPKCAWDVYRPPAFAPGWLPPFCDAGPMMCGNPFCDRSSVETRSPPDLSLNVSQLPVLHLGEAFVPEPTFRCLAVAKEGGASLHLGEAIGLEPTTFAVCAAQSK